MSRRRLLTYSSSDEDDSPRHQQHQQQQQQSISTQDTDSIMQHHETTVAESLASTSLNPSPNYDFPSPPMEISDDDDVFVDDEVFVDVTDNLSPPSPEAPILEETNQNREELVENSDNVLQQELEHLVQEQMFERYTNEDGGMEEEVGEVGLIKEVLSRVGLRVRTEWMKMCLRGLERSVNRFGGFSADRKAEACFGQFLVSDMNCCGVGVMPANISGMHDVDLAGPFVLQVDEIVNISCPLRQRYNKAAPGNKRCLKLSMTDGVQRVYGMEYRPVKDLDVFAPAGLKVAICNVHVRHGLLMIVPEVIEILGGKVEELEAAHQRLIAEINKPPRGRRPRMGDVLPLATRATQAAWSSALSSGHEPTPNTRPQNSASVPAPIGVSAQGPSFRHRLNDPGTPFSMRDGGDSPNQNFHFNAQATRREQHQSRAIDVPTLSTRTTPDASPPVGANDSVHDHISHFTSQHSGFVHASAGGAQGYDQALQPDPQTSDVEMINASIKRDRREASYFSNEVNREPANFNRQFSTFVDIEDIDMTDDVVETMVNTRSTAEIEHYSSPMGNTEGPNVCDEAENPPFPLGNQVIPFTYLSSLSAELLAAEASIATVKGKIKCFMTGVKTFQFKGRKTYELRAYVEDGSLISEILIDHSVVQDKVGYSPAEVNAALSSPDANTVSRMKEIMKQFRSFLVNFEGTMTVELKKSSPTPIAVEMTHGCSSSEACMLLRRVKSYMAAQTTQSSEPIVLSP